MHLPFKEDNSGSNPDGFTMNKIFAIISTCLLLGGCVVYRYLPAENNTTVRDSVCITFKDSTIYHHRTVNRDYAGLLDTLRIQGERSAMKAFADTSNFTIKGELREEPIKERIVYKDRIQYRDSIQYVKEPYPVEVVKEKKYIPKFFWGTFVFTVLALLLFAAKIYIKIKTGAIQLPKLR